MKFPFRILFLPLLICFGLSQPAAGSVIFKPGEKAKYKTPGEEEISGNAQEMFSKAQEAEKSGNIKRAIKTYSALVRRHPRDTLAPGSLYHMAQLQEQIHDYFKAIPFWLKNSRRASVSTSRSKPSFESARCIWREKK
jgi:TolA-binding protein